MTEEKKLEWLKMIHNRLQHYQLNHPQMDMRMINEFLNPIVEYGKNMEKELNRNG